MLNLSKKKIVIIVSVLVVAILAIGFWFFYFKNNPLTNQPNQTTLLKVYFSNSQENENQTDCSKVFPVERQVPKTQVVALAALAELLKGPSKEEKEQGYFSWFSTSTANLLKSIKIENETAYVVFDRTMEDLIPGAGSSCGGAELLAELDNTLKQFSTIKNTAYSFNGNPRWFYGWLQMGCPDIIPKCDSSAFDTK